MIDACEWQVNVKPYTGEASVAIMALTTIPEAERLILVEKVRLKQHDDLAVVTRDNIAGKKYAYRTELAFMNFGTGQTCKVVTRHKWDPIKEYGARVFCAGNHCIAHHSGCGNWSVIYRMPEHVAKSEITGLTPAGTVPMMEGLAPAPTAETSTQQGPRLAPQALLPAYQVFGPVFYDQMPAILPPPITNVVSEPPVWSLILLGLAVGMLFDPRSKKK